jgi:hypothetical protein
MIVVHDSDDDHRNGTMHEGEEESLDREVSDETDSSDSQSTADREEEEPGFCTSPRKSPAGTAFTFRANAPMASSFKLPVAASSAAKASAKRAKVATNAGTKVGFLCCSSYEYR